ncbi:MAG: AIR synthase-related protein [Lentisphaeria bacterium]|jgi:phosphoribosylformylglycinamidine synthase
MDYRLEISVRPGETDPRGQHVGAQARDFLHLPVAAVETRDVYSLYLDATPAQAQEILDAFTNPVIQAGKVGATVPDASWDWLVIVGFKPGVTDNVARSARSAIADILGRPPRDDEEVYSAVEYLVKGDQLTAADLKRLASGLLANDLIQTSTVLSRAEAAAQGIPANRPVVLDPTPPRVTSFNLEVADAELERISRDGVLALSLEEMKAIQRHFREEAGPRRELGLPPCPTDVELEVLAQTWSEHCKHKIFAAKIEYTDTTTGLTQTVDSLFKSYIRRATEEVGQRVAWLVSVFHDNAGVIKFNDQVHLVYKAETHNSPTALDPYGGAMTGIVGVNRDPLGTGMGADLLLNVWGYCFGSPFTAPEEVPPGLFHPRRLRDQVHKGVIDGGNQSGIPYACGWEYFDPRYLGKPLVYCGTVGTLPVTLNGQPAEQKSIQPGDLVVMCGGRIGKDGIHGATFSSEELHAGSPVQAVQIGDPITQKVMADFLLEARDRGLYRFITDNGAGGLSSSLGEMADHCGGVEVELAKAPLKYAGLQPWEIFVSEAQERMSLAVPPEKAEPFLELARRRNVEAAVLGKFTASGHLHLTFQGKTVAHLKLAFLHDGLPQLKLKATWVPPAFPEPELPADFDLEAALLTMLGRLNVCSGEFKARQYDHEVKGLSVVKPYVGAHGNLASDATVSLVAPLATEGVILAAGICPRYSDIDTYHMMASAIDIAVRRTIAVGGQLGHIAGLDNFCWPDPVQGPKTPDGEYKCAQLVRANQALYDLCTAYDVPCVSGKDSMKNDSTKGGRKISIPPTVLFSTIAKMPDVRKAVTLDAKRYGDLVYVLGLTRNELGGSEFYNQLGATGNQVPKVEPVLALELYRRVATLTNAELCHSLHTPVFGGLAVAFAKVAMGGDLGLEVDLKQIPVQGGLGVVERLFSESNSRFVATVAPANRERFEALLAGVPFACVGEVTLQRQLLFRNGRKIVARIPVPDALAAYTGTLDGI